MLVEHLPRLDVQRLVTSGPAQGRLCLRRGLKIRYTVGLSVDETPQSVAIAIDGGGHYHYQLRKGVTQRHMASCPECAGWTEFLYWCPTLVKAKRDPAAVCRTCVGATWLSCNYSHQMVPGLRADIRSKSYQPVIDAIRNGHYIEAWVAFEKEFDLPQAERLFTRVDGHSTRYQNQE